MSFYFLQRYISFKDKDNFFTYALKKTIGLGGDTDTNACIVCGIVGALVGFKKIDKNMIGKVLSFDCTNDGITRPDFLSTKYNLVPQIKKLINQRPVIND